MLLFGSCCCCCLVVAVVVVWLLLLVLFGCCCCLVVTVLFGCCTSSNISNLVNEWQPLVPWLSQIKSKEYCSKRPAHCKNSPDLVYFLFFFVSLSLSIYLSLSLSLSVSPYLSEEICDGGRFAASLGVPRHLTMMVCLLMHLLLPRAQTHEDLATPSLVVLFPQSNLMNARHLHELSRDEKSSEDHGPIKFLTSFPRTSMFVPRIYTRMVGSLFLWLSWFWTGNFSHKRNTCWLLLAALR